MTPSTEPELPDCARTADAENNKPIARNNGVSLCRKLFIFSSVPLRGQCGRVWIEAAWEKSGDADSNRNQHTEGRFFCKRGGHLLQETKTTRLEERDRRGAGKTNSGVPHVRGEPDTGRSVLVRRPDPVLQLPVSASAGTG